MAVVATEKISRRSFESPDETRAFDRGRSEVLSVGELTLSRTVFEPGWKWSTSVKPLVGGESCRVRHIGYMISGRLHTVMDDGTEQDYGPGDVVLIPPGHDGWTIGDEPAVLLQIAGAAEYAKK
jgi:quercetin dioxygenase-like cupin family protein